MEIIKEINNILSSNGLKIKINENNKETNLKDFGIDSISLFQVILDLEKKYSIRFPDEELMDIKTPKDLINLVEKNLK